MILSGRRSVHIQLFFIFFLLYFVSGCFCWLCVYSVRRATKPWNLKGINERVSKEEEKINSKKTTPIRWEIYQCWNYECQCIGFLLCFSVKLCCWFVLCICSNLSRVGFVFLFFCFVHSFFRNYSDIIL